MSPINKLIRDLRNIQTRKLQEHATIENAIRILNTYKEARP